MTLILLVAVIGLIAVRSDDRHFFPLAMFTVITLSFQLTEPSLIEWSYLVGALLDVVCLWGLSKLSYSNSSVKWVAGVCGLSIAFNFIGWVMYLSYLDPLAYYLAFVTLYIMLLLRISGGLHGMAKYLRTTRRVFGSDYNRN